jgi:hypothetical protein
MNKIQSLGAAIQSITTAEGTFEDEVEDKIASIPITPELIKQYKDRQEKDWDDKGISHEDPDHVMDDDWWADLTRVELYLGPLYDKVVAALEKLGYTTNGEFEYDVYESGWMEGPERKAICEAVISEVGNEYSDYMIAMIVDGVLVNYDKWLKMDLDRWEPIIPE